MEKTPVALYVEIPFRAKPCAWQEREYITGWDTQRNQTYLQAVIREILANATEFRDCMVTAVRFGGGCASMAGPAVADIAHAVRECFDVAPTAQWSMTAGVASISGASFPYFKRAGMQRFDFQMGTLFQPIFAHYNNIDNFDDFGIVCDHFLHSYANNSLGLELVYGHADLSERDARRSFLGAAGTHASHISLVAAQGASAAPEELTQAHLAQAHEVLGEAGFSEYLPGMFARPGCEDEFVRMQHKGADVLAFGLGATTRFAGAASTNTTDFDLYCEYSYDFTKITTSSTAI